MPRNVLPATVTFRVSSGRAGSTGLSSDTVTAFQVRGRDGLRECARVGEDACMLRQGGYDGQVGGSQAKGQPGIAGKT